MAALVVAGCGNNYRPVVTPVNPNGPPPQIAAYVVAVSAPSPASPGVATIIDYSGDTILNEQPLLGVGPIAFTIDETGANGYTYNTDGTITNFPVSTTFQYLKDEHYTTVNEGAEPINIDAPNMGLWIGDLSVNSVDIFTGSPQKITEVVPLAPATTPAFIAGTPTATAGQREYAISQNIASSTGVECNISPTTQQDGTATPIEVNNYTLDVPIPVGKCPVYAVQSYDQRRLFVLNRGDDTITVINSQSNALDDGCPQSTGGCTNQNGQTYYTHPVLPLSLNAVTATGVTPPNGTSGMTATAGPVYAEYNQALNLLVVANYDGGTISVIDVSLDQYGNDSPTFGTTYTIPVGNNSATSNPASVTVLADGSKAYTANQNDASDGKNGTVTVVNLSTHTVEKTLTIVGHPRTVVSTQNSGYSKVYVASPDSPYITIISSTPTVADTVDTTILLEGNTVDVRTTTQAGAAQTVAAYNGTLSISVPNFSSRVPGYGQPCNLPGMPAPTGSETQLQACQAIP